MLLAAIGLTRAAGVAGARLQGSVGLVQTVYGTESFSGPPLLQRVTRAIDLSVFDEHPRLPRRFVSMTWAGVWLVQEAGPVDIYAGADDRVRILVDDRLIIERNQQVGSGTDVATVTLGAGAHRVSIEYAQRGGDRALKVLWAPAGKRPRRIDAASLFVSTPDGRLTAQARWAARLEFGATVAWYAFGAITLLLVLLAILVGAWRALRSGVPQAALRRADHALMRWGDRRGRVACWLLTAGAACWAAVRWGAALNPETLWSDDVAVACLAKVESLWEAVSVTSPLPPGFVTLLWITRRLLADPEVSLQLWPLAFGLAGPVLVGLVVSRLTASRLLGFIATVLGLGNATLSQYAIFVKPYSLDYAATAMLLWLGVRLLVDRSIRLWPVAVTGLASALFALPSVMMSVALVHIGALAPLPATGDSRAERRRRWGTAAGFDGLLAAMYLVVYRHRSNPGLRSYWLDGFAPTSSLADLSRFLATTGWTAIRDALPGPLAWLAALAAVGLVALAWSTRQRWFVLFVVTCYAGVLAASMLQVYPIGIGSKARVSIFAYPLMPALVAVGIGALTRWMPRARVSNAAAAVAVAMVAAGVPPPVYPPLELSRLARALESRAEPTDAVVVNTAAAALAGYYATWPITLYEDQSPYGFTVRFPRPRTLTLPRLAEEGGPGLEMLDRFLAEEQPSRLFLFTTRRATEPAEQMIRAHGFEERDRSAGRISTRLIEYRRAGS